MAPPRGEIKSIPNQVRYWFLFSGRNGQGARAIGESRHHARTRLDSGQHVSIGKVHSLRTLDEYIRIVTDYGRWADQQYGEKRLTHLLRHPEWARAWLASKDLAPATHATYVSALIKAVEIVRPADRVRWELLRDETPRRPSATDRAYADEAVERLVAYFRERSPEAALVTELARAAGLRAGEIVRHGGKVHHALTPGQIDADGTLQVVGKGGRHRMVQISPALAGRLLAHAAAAGRGLEQPLFQLHYDQYRRQLLKACVRLGVPYRAPHGLRYSYAQGEHAAALARGASDDEADRLVSELIGHRRPHITHRYLGRGSASRVGGAARPVVHRERLPPP